MSAELTLVVGDPANGGSCVARHEGRVVFVRHALPGERVRARVTDARTAFWHADAVEILEPSADRIAPLCPIAGVDGSGCCDLSFVDPAAARTLKTAVVANQLARLGGQHWDGQVQPLGPSATGWRTRVRLAVDPGGRPGFHRYHSEEVVTDLRCGQLAPELLDGLALWRFPVGAAVHVVRDDDGRRHVVQAGRDVRTEVVEGGYEATHRVGGRTWRVPVTAFWQSHPAAPARYSELVGEWAELSDGQTAWDLYGGAGVFAAVLADAVGERGSVRSVDTSRLAGRAAREALADSPQVEVVTDSVKRVLQRNEPPADVAVLDPPRTGAGREVVEALARAGVPRIIHIGCEVAAFARDVGLYREHGYAVARLEAFDAFPLTHHVEGIALLTRER
ncbi:TRAM domain-containing protein [Mycobacterium sp. MYCO198283]|uniref:class I SAM-dependent RNA methyltransferase n=1 Tax=Mycobacterium sp. MYCO198283 TaxID=2883505 RepID=UPI001E2EF742|nr:TRAM domain-containing protein [Mycobacterium sp. MYCO198283]MCG5433909.1 TRAM domain-containing protein [Mycobacterium sp. MYCO198283]